MPSKIYPENKIVRVAHSPDADDRFMFWPIRAGLVKTGSFQFQFREADTQTLNKLALEDRPEICAISAIHYGRVFEHYQPLLMGASVGDNYGPVVVSNQPEIETFNAENHPFALLSPGPQTTAHTVLTLLGHSFKDVEFVPISPLERVFNRLKELKIQNTPAVALLIHEGRLTFKQFGCHKLLDIGEQWFQRTGGSLPLGLNVISRQMSDNLRTELSEILIASCDYALKNKSTYLDLAKTQSSPWYSPLTTTELDSYLSLYANETTRSISDADKKSFLLLMDEAWNMKLIGSNSKPTVDWI